MKQAVVMNWMIMLVMKVVLEDDRDGAIDDWKLVNK